MNSQEESRKALGLSNNMYGETIMILDGEIIGLSPTMEIDLLQKMEVLIEARERAAEEHFIALICKDPNCSVAIVKLREEYDPPTATSMTLFCPKHDTEGDYPYYFDKDGEEVSGDPETFTKRQSLKEKES